MGGCGCGGKCADRGAGVPAVGGPSPRTMRSIVVSSGGCARSDAGFLLPVNHSTMTPYVPPGPIGEAIGRAGVVIGRAARAVTTLTAANSSHGSIAVEINKKKTATHALDLAGLGAECWEKNKAASGYEQTHRFVITLPSGVGASSKHMVKVVGGGYWVKYGPTMTEVIDVEPFQIRELFKVHGASTRDDTHFFSTSESDVCAVLGIGSFRLSLVEAAFRPGAASSFNSEEGSTPEFVDSSSSNVNNNRSGPSPPDFRAMKVGEEIHGCSGSMSYGYFPVHCDLSGLELWLATGGAGAAAGKKVESDLGRLELVKFIQTLHDAHDGPGGAQPAPGTVVALHGDGRSIESRTLAPGLGAMEPVSPEGTAELAVGVEQSRPFEIWRQRDGGRNN
jgi:hypothetical protein